MVLAAALSRNWWVWSSLVARVTVEDCIDKVSNRFDLVLLAGQRARQISGGAELTVDPDRDQNPGVVRREVAEEPVLLEQLTDTVGAGVHVAARAAVRVAGGREWKAWVEQDRDWG